MEWVTLLPWCFLFRSGEGVEFLLLYFLCWRDSCLSASIFCMVNHYYIEFVNSSWPQVCSLAAQLSYVPAPCRPKGPEIPAQWAISSLWQVVLSWSTVTSSYWNSQVHSKWHSHGGRVSARNADCLVEVYQSPSHLEQPQWSSRESSCGGEALGPTAERQVLPTNRRRDNQWLPHPRTNIPT